MQLSIKVDLNSAVNKKAMEAGVQKKWNKAIKKAVKYIQNDIRNSMINGGYFKKPFTQTYLWEYLNSQEALGELGFITTKPLTEDLLPSLQDGTFVEIKDGKRILIKFINMDTVAQGTIHRSAGTGRLGDISWFVDWIINGMVVQDYEFVETGPPRPRSSMIAGSKAGLMFESVGGFWKFPPMFKGEFELWVFDSLKDIENIIAIRMYEALNKV